MCRYSVETLTSKTEDEMVNAAVAVGQRTVEEDAVFQKIFDQDTETAQVDDQTCKYHQLYAYLCMYNVHDVFELKDIVQKLLCTSKFSIATNLEFILNVVDVCFRLYHVLLSFIIYIVFCCTVSNSNL